MTSQESSLLALPVNFHSMRHKLSPHRSHLLGDKISIGEHWSGSIFATEFPPSPLPNGCCCCCCCVVLLHTHCTALRCSFTLYVCFNRTLRLAFSLVFASHSYPNIFSPTALTSTSNQSVATADEEEDSQTTFLPPWPDVSVISTDDLLLSSTENRTTQLPHASKLEENFTNTIT